MSFSNSPEDRCAVVLGGTGWVGRHLCETFARRGYRVVALARKPVDGVRHDAFVPLDLITASATRIGDVLREQRATVVVNATDGANATDGWERTEADLKNANVGLVNRLLAGIASLPSPPRMVHVGTVHEYGPMPVGTAVTESTEPSPANAYARSKLAGSAAVMEAARAGRADAIVLRVVNVCGPYPSPASLPGKLLPLLDRATRTGRIEIAIAPDRRDFVDVGDLADAVWRAAERPGLAGVINIGSGAAVALRDFVTLFVTGAGLPPSALVELPAPARGLGGAWIRADNRRAGEALGWAPRTSLDQSVRATWKAFRAG